MDMMGNQVLTGSKTRVNGNALHEWGGRSAPTDQFGGRDMVRVGDTFGEAFIYYQGRDPMTGGTQPKVGFLKRVVAQGVPVIVGAGYAASPDRTVSTVSCSDRYVTAPAIQSPEDIQAFVQCAAEYAMEHGPEEARRAFNEDDRWRRGPFYVFVDGIAPSAADAVSHVFPPEPEREGTPWGEPLIDNFGTGYFPELHRIMSIADSGWIYYAFTNFESGIWEPKGSYVKAIDWNGERAAIGAGIYRRDLPGTCTSAVVNAAALEVEPSRQRLEEFVRCAAMQVESMGLFAAEALSHGPRWNSGTIYVFGANVETGEIEFSGNESSFLVSGRISELLYGGRDVSAVMATFGEAFLYYKFMNRATGIVENKISFNKLVLAQGVPLTVGSGYHLYPDDDPQ